MNRGTTLIDSSQSPLYNYSFQIISDIEHIYHARALTVPRSLYLKLRCQSNNIPIMQNLLSSVNNQTQ